MKKTFLLPLLMLLAIVSQAQTTILSESFNTTFRTTTPPTGWTVSGTGTNDNTCSSAIVWEQVPSGGFNCFGTPNPAAHSGSGMAGYNAWDIYSGGNTELVSPVLNFSGLGTTTLNVWIWDSVALYYGFPNTQYDSLAIYVNTSPTSAGGTQLYRGTPSYNFSGTGWTLFTFNIPTTYNGATNYIIFRGASRYGNDIFFDDVTVVRNPPTPCNATPLAPTITTAAMSTASPLCAGSTKTLTASDPNYPTIGGFTYEWQTSASSSGPWTTVSTSTTSTNGTVTYTTAPLTTSTYYRLNTKCTATGNANASAPYFVIVGAPQPGTITGSPTFCPGDISTYSVPIVAGTTYTWTLPSGWSGSSTTNSINVTPNSTAGTISVTATSSCGTSIPQTKPIAPGSAPGTPGNITGSNSSCASASQTYSIAAVPGATSYAWTVPAGWSINSTTNGGQTINVTTGGTSGNVTATAINGCGSSSKSLYVTVVTALPNPGTISGPSSPCAGALYTYSIHSVLGATSYVWGFPSGWTAVANDTTLQVFAGTAGGYITVTAHSPCSTSPTSSLAVTVQQSVTPTVNVTASDSPICQSAPITFTANTTNAGSSPTYMWQKNGTPVIGSGSTYLDNKLTTGDVITATVVSNASCRTIDTARSSLTLSVTPLASPGISINAAPLLTICSGTLVSFSTTITGGGPSPSYQWYLNNNPITSATGPSYSSALLANNDTITVKLTTSAVCPYVPYVFSNKVGMQVNNVVSPSVTISASSTQPVAGQPITISSAESGGGATPVYQWILNNVDIPGATSDSYTSSAFRDGDRISVRMISYDPCAQPGVVTSNEIIMGDPTSVAGLTSWDGVISLYPNPTTGRFTISAEWNTTHAGKQVNIDLLNMIGQNVYHVTTIPDKAQWRFDVRLSENIPNGQYMLRISSSDGMRAAVPVILNR